MFENLKADLSAAQEDRKLEKGILRVMFRMETIAIISYRFGHWVESLRIPLVRQLLLIAAMILQRFVQVLVGIYISPDAEIGPGLTIHTPFGIIVGPNKIGENLTIQSGVVIAAGTRGIGDNVYFGAGAKVMGGAKIGNNVVVAANSLVLTDVPDNMTVIGVPARIRIPGGRPKRFKWNTVKPQNGKERAVQPTNGNKPSQQLPEPATKAQ